MHRVERQEAAVAGTHEASNQVLQDVLFLPRHGCILLVSTESPYFRLSILWQECPTCKTLLLDANNSCYSTNLFGLQEINLIIL